MFSSDCQAPFNRNSREQNALSTGHSRDDSSAVRHVEYGLQKELENNGFSVVLVKLPFYPSVQQQFHRVSSEVLL